MHLWSIVEFNNAPHRDNEDVKVWAPFSSSDDAFAFAAEAGMKFYHIVQMIQPTGRLQKLVVKPKGQ